MGEDSLQLTIGGFVLLSLFMFLSLVFLVSVAQDNGKDTTQFEEGAFSLDPYESFLEDVQGDSEDFRKRFEKGNIFSVVSGIVFEGIFGLANDMVVLAITPFTLFAQVLNNIIGIPSIVVSVILGLLILSIVFGIWALVKIGR